MAVSPYFDDLQDDPDNYVIITPGEVVHDNPNPTYAWNDGIPPPEWTEQVITSGPSREGDYRVIQVLDGDSVEGAVTCCIAHARNGERDSQLWNGSWDDADDISSATCKPIITADVRFPQTSQTTFTTYANGWSDDDEWMIGGGAGAIANGPAYFCWHLPVRDNMPPRGALDFIPQPEDYGYPPFSEGTEIEWEFPYPELVSIEVADGDAVESADFPNIWSYNSEIGPVYPAADPDAGWKRGLPGDGVSWTYDFGDVAWQAIPDTDGWDGHGWAENYAEDPTTADATVIAMPYTNTENVNWGRFARVAFKYNLQARRFRFITAGTARAPRRVASNESPARAYPLSSQLRSNRVAGTYL